LSGAFTLLMISGYIDLSVGSGMSLTAVVFAWLVLNGASFWVAISATLVLGLVMGALNGLLVVRLRITPVIATLVTLRPVQRHRPADCRDWRSAVKAPPPRPCPAGSTISPVRMFSSGLPWAFWVAILVIALMAIAQRKTLLGKYAAAIGGNRLAAELSGINAVKTIWLALHHRRVFAALAGVAPPSCPSAIRSLATVEFNCLIAVLLGGTAFQVEGSVTKTVIGSLIIICVTIGLMTVIPAYWQNVAKGTVLVAAVVLNHLLVREKVKA
jgi:ribose/xylose/arabinose/galactoside ABC-type transport system permease subunit